MALFLFSVRNLLSPWFTATSKSTKSPALEICLNFPGVTWTRQCPLSDKLYFSFVGGDKTKQCTKFEVSSFTGFRDILEGMPNFLAVTWPRPYLFSEILYFRLVGRAKLKLCTNLELNSFTGFGDMIEGMPKILGVTWARPRPFHKYYTSFLWEEPRWSWVPNLKSLALFVFEI